MGLYLVGEYPRGEYVCGHHNTIVGANCIIDNEHEGRPHWGPDNEGQFVQWGPVGKASIASTDRGVRRPQLVRR